MNNPWKFVLLNSIGLNFISFFWSLVIACLLVSLFVSFQIGNWKGGLVPSIEEFQSRSEGPTTLRYIGLRSTPNWVKHHRENTHQNWELFFCKWKFTYNWTLVCLPSLFSNFVTKRPFIGSKLGASNRSPYFHLCVII